MLAVPFYEVSSEVSFGGDVGGVVGGMGVIGFGSVLWIISCTSLVIKP